MTERTLYLLPQDLGTFSHPIEDYAVWEHLGRPLKDVTFDRIDDSHYPPGADAFPGIEELRMRVRGTDDAFLKLHDARRCGESDGCCTLCSTMHEIGVKDTASSRYVIVQRPPLRTRNSRRAGPGTILPPVSLFGRNCANDSTSACGRSSGVTSELAGAAAVTGNGASAAPFAGAAGDFASSLPHAAANAAVTAQTSSQAPRRRIPMLILASPSGPVVWWASRPAVWLSGQRAPQDLGPTLCAGCVAGRFDGLMRTPEIGGSAAAVLIESA